MHHCDIIIAKGWCKHMEIGEKIRYRRMQLRMSQRELARRMGYEGNSTLARIEQGKIDLPQSRIGQFADVLGVSISWLMGWEEAEKKNDQLVPLVTRLRKDDAFFNVYIPFVYLLAGFIFLKHEYTADS